VVLTSLEADWKGGSSLSVGLEFIPRDFWVGVYWKDSVFGHLRFRDVWIGFIPMLPIHVCWGRRRRAEA
jgi:hypothetical protein